MDKMNNPPLNKRRLIILVIIAIFLAVLSISFVVYLALKPQPVRAYKNIVGSDKVIGLQVEERGDGIYSIHYRIPAQGVDSATEEFFSVNATDLISKKRIELGSESPFFSCSNRSSNKIIYIILDVSQSVVGGIGDTYFDQVISKINTILSTDVIQPGDQIRVRFMGANNDRIQNIDFTGPKFTYELSKNEVQRKNTLNLTNYSYSALTKCQNTDNIMSLRDLSQRIKSMYNSRISTPDSESNISELLQTISNEVSLQQNNFKSVRYILFTDGDSTDKYGGCEIDACQKWLQNLDLNNDPTNKTYAIWVKGTSKQEIFRKMFGNISVNFQ